LVAGLALIAAAVVPSVAHATYSGHDGRIVYTVRDSKGPDGHYCLFDCLYSVHPNGSGLKRIGDDSDAASFSPSGELAYSSDAGIVTARADGGHKHVINGDADAPPVWSPDGKRIIYIDPFIGGADVIDAKTGKPAGGFELPWGIRDSYSWGATNRLALSRDLGDPDPCTGDGDSYNDIYTLGAKGDGMHQLTSNFASQQPDWSPRGRSIVFTRNGAVHKPKGVVAADCKRGAGNPRIVAKVAAGTRLRPTVTSAGRTSQAGGSIWVVRSTGGRAKRFTSGHDDWQPVWSLDGKRMLFVRFTSRGTPWIYEMNADGAHPRRLFRGIFPAWQPVP
jgi:Tol biopolymer transport system component